MWCRIFKLLFLRCSVSRVSPFRRYMCLNICEQRLPPACQEAPPPEETEDLTLANTFQLCLHHTDLIHSYLWYLILVQPPQYEIQNKTLQYYQSGQQTHWFTTSTTLRTVWPLYHQESQPDHRRPIQSSPSLFPVTAIRLTVWSPSGPKKKMYKNSFIHSTVTALIGPTLPEEISTDMLLNTTAI